MAQKRGIFLFCGALFIFSVVAVVNAQQQKSLKVDVDLVMVNVSVTDPDNKLVNDLKTNNFQVYEDKVEQQIRYFSTEQQPLSLGLVFDVSHSMEPKIALARDAAARFLDTGSPEDEYFLVEFSSRAKITEDFTTDVSRLRDHLALVPPRGDTAMYDAVYLGLSKVRKGSNPKKALLLITDGEDNHSRYSRHDIREFARESDVQIYSIDLGRALIGDLSDMTGGHSFHAHADQLEDVCAKIAEELKSQYIIGYASTNTNKDGKYRKVRVRVNAPAGMPKLNVRSKDGYYAPNG
jgi:Ca-activated chloride channel family protein